MSDAFSILQDLREALRYSDEADPKIVAAEVAESVPNQYRTIALVQALIAIAPTVNAQVRTSAFRHTGMPGSVRWKTAAVEYRDEVLSQRVMLDGRPPKFLRDCTRDDLLRAANMRREHAEQVMAQAVVYEKLAALLDEAGAATVGDLDDQALKEIL